MQQNSAQENPILHVSHHLESVLLTPGQTNSPLTNHRSALNQSQGSMKVRGLIATLWLTLTDVYGVRFVNQYGSCDESGVWAMALEGFDEEDVRFGLKAMICDIRFETWPPNCTQFRHLCLSCLNECPQQLPSVHKAFIEALNNLWLKNPVWSHDGVKCAIKLCGIHKLTEPRVDRAFKDFSQAYSKVSKRVLSGEALPSVSNDEVRLPAYKKSNNSPKLLLRGLL